MSSGKDPATDAVGSDDYLADDISDDIMNTSNGGKANSKQDRRNKNAKNAASDQMMETILQKQQEINCKKCEVLNREIEAKEQQIQCLTKEKEEQKLATEDLKSSIEAKKRVIEDLREKNEKQDKIKRDAAYG